MYLLAAGLPLAVGGLRPEVERRLDFLDMSSSLVVRDGVFLGVPAGLIPLGVAAGLAPSSITVSCKE